VNITIAKLIDTPEFADIAARWLTEQWPDGLSVSARKERLLAHADCPPTLLALSDHVPLGVLAFRRFRRDGNNYPSLFIDALYVHASARRGGLGSKLLASAVDAAASTVRELFVYTSLREWYVSRGWAVVEAGPDAGCFVLTRVVA